MGETYRAERKVDTEKAKNSDASITDRLDSGVDAAIDGAKELAEGAQKEYEATKAEYKKDNVTSSDNNQGILASATEYMKETAESVGDYFTNPTEVAKHKAKEETYRAERKVDTEQAKNNDASITDRLDSGVDAAIDGAKELAEGAQKEYAELKSDNASSDSNQGILSSIGGFFSSSAKEAG